ncbi:MAG: two-component system sensor histidine kinase KdpD [Chitinivorax sp.]
MDNERPDPDELLDKLQKSMAKQQRGRLKVFFGGCAGVGKTYAMLAAAQTLRQQGVDVVIGVIETHGRSETEKMLQGLELLPRLQLSYRDRDITEFDLDGALQRKPSIILVDELAHSNVAGSRHPKRWQDVEELLAAGINVYTTLNVQHLESLNDVVGQITGIRVSETLPDKVFDLADEVNLVDLPPDELLLRLKQGKVYIPTQAERASKHFFRKGNLIALRELALRRTADRVDAQMREYRADQSIQQVWQAKDRLLVCVGPGAESEQLVRVCARLAASLKADWLAVYVETPQLQRLSEQQRADILKTLQLAKELGAETATLSGADIAVVLLGYAKSRNVSKVIVGKPARPPLLRLFSPSVGDELARLTQDIDIYVVARDTERRDQAQERQPLASMHFDFEPSSRRQMNGYLWAIGTSIAITALASLLVRHLDLSNVVMLFLLGVILISVRHGRRPGILASILSVAAFDFFFVPPRWSFSVSDTQYLITFAVMLIVALVISNLTSTLRYQANVATHRERRTRALFDLGKELAGALTTPQIVEISTRYLSGVFQAKVALLLPDSHEKVKLLGGDNSHASQLHSADYGIGQWVYDHQQPAGLGSDTLPSSNALYLPLKAPMRTRGVLVMAPAEARLIFLPEQQRLLETFASQIALALERVHYVEVAQDALLNMESERLRNSVLSAISHDLRTPLTAIIGLSDTLKETTADSVVREELADAIQEEAFRMNNLVTNLLDMARLQAGKVKLNRQWQMLEEVVGGAIRGLERPLSRHHVDVSLPRELPLLEFDAVLIERVLANILDNAAKYTPAGSHIRIVAERRQDEIWVSVSDDGLGLPDGMEHRIFDKFTRGDPESAKSGVGLGLSICRAIIEAHGGRIWASNLPGHGAIFTFALPIGNPPTVPELDN